MRFTICIILLAIILYGCGPSLKTTTYRDPFMQLRKEINSILYDSLFFQTRTSIKIVSLHTGDVFYEHDSKALMNPASNIKLLTSATALAILDSGYQFKTCILTDRYSSDSTMVGNVYLKGFGNPILSTADLDSLASIVHRSGILKIEGNIIADKSYFDDEYWGSGWMWDDESDPDAPYINALSVNGNCISVSISIDPFDSTAAMISLEPQTDFISIINRVTITSDSVQIPLKIKRITTDKFNTIMSEGEFPRWGGPITQKVSLRYPHLYTAQLFKESLDRVGILVKGEIIEGTTPYKTREITQYSHSIKKVMNYLNKFSDNLSAENTLKILGSVMYGVPGTAANGLYVVKYYLSTIGIDTTKFSIVDGSGVSRYNLLTADQLVRLLAAVYKSRRIFPILYDALPIAGVDGTLTGRMNNTLAEGNLHAKTGTLNGVSCLSGYVRTLDSELLAFSIMMQNFLTSPENYRRAQDKIGILLANFSRKKFVDK